MYAADAADVLVDISDIAFILDAAHAANGCIQFHAGIDLR